METTITALKDCRVEKLVLKVETIVESGDWV